MYKQQLTTLPKEFLKKYIHDKIIIEGPHNGSIFNTYSFFLLVKNIKANLNGIPFKAKYDSDGYFDMWHYNEFIAGRVLCENFKKSQKRPGTVKEILLDLYDNDPKSIQLV
jgi:hypothetical protein